MKIKITEKHLDLIRNNTEVIDLIPYFRYYYHETTNGMIYHNYQTDDGIWFFISPSKPTIVRVYTSEYAYNEDPKFISKEG